MAGPSLFRVLKDSGGTKLSGVAKTATFNSEALNLQGFGIFGLILDVGTVSGTSPTLDIKVQLSADGSTWLDTYPEKEDSETQFTFTQITATIETARFVANWLPGADQSGDFTPRARFVFTIGGTSPSFTFTNVYIVGRSYST